MGTDYPAGRPGFRPSHPGAVLRRDLEALGATQEEFADHIGVSRQTISAVIAGRSGMSVELAVKVARAVGGETRFWTNLQTAYDAWDIEKKPGVVSIRKMKLSRLASLGAVSGGKSGASGKSASAVRAKTAAKRTTSRRGKSVRLKSA